MNAYGEDERGHLFRWDGGLGAWFRIPPDDDEYDTALSAVYGARGACAGRGRPGRAVGSPDSGQLAVASS